MNDDTLTKRVVAAQGGDTHAYADLVRTFQQRTVASAFAWLGDAELARDVSQDALLDAWQLLSQLREPRAFGGWLGHIVRKHCDRRTRRRDPVTGAATLPELADGEQRQPGNLAASAERAYGLRLAVAALPAAQRQVVALTYLADCSGSEVAEFLDVPLSTVKKRLRAARARLRNEGDRLMEQTREQLRAAGADGLGAEVELFIALRAGDRGRVKELLAADPALANAEQNWDNKLVHGGVLPFANRANALITVIELGDAELQRLLCEAGADVNGRCGCGTAEPPVWAAAVFNRVEQARDLLLRGADPNVTSASGTTALHVAAMRGNLELVRALLAAGADVTLMDGGGAPDAPWNARLGRSAAPRTAAEWARINGHEAVAQLLDAPPAAAAAAPDRRLAILTASHPDVLLTGIKTLDLFAPLPRGGLVRLPFRAGVGMIVLLGELCTRIGRAGGEAVWTGFAQPPFDVVDLQADLAEFGQPSGLRLALASFKVDPDTRRAAFDAGITAARDAARGGRNVLAIVQSTQGFEADVEAVLPRLAEPCGTAGGAVTTIVMGPFGDDDDAWPALRAPWNGQLVLDRRRARRQLFPALHPWFSRSDRLTDKIVGARHVLLAESARELLHAYRHADPDFEQVDERAERGELGARLLRWLCQPFVCTEPFTGRPGEIVDRDALLAELGALLER